MLGIGLERWVRKIGERLCFKRERKGGLKVMIFYSVLFIFLSRLIGDVEKKFWNLFMYICNRINVIKVVLKRVSVDFKSMIKIYSRLYSFR